MEIFVVVALVWLLILQNKVNGLSLQIKQLTNKDAAEVQPSNTIPTEEVVMPLATGHAIPLQTTNLAPGLTVPVAAAPAPSPFFEWLKEDIMLKIGALLLLIALGWFLSYAFANNWIGEMGRITLGLFMGAALMIVGVWRIKTFVQQGGVFLVLGSTTIILTLYAARNLYDLFDPVSALGLMFLSVVCVAFVSVQYNRKPLALASLLLAAVAPLLIAQANPSVLGLNIYLLVMVIGTLWVVYVRGWSVLTFTSFLIVVFYGLPVLTMSGGELMVGLLGAFVFVTIFFVANIIGLVINESAENKNYHILIAAGTGLYLILWTLAAVPETLQSLVMVSWMFVFSIGTFLVYQANGNKLPFYIYGGTSIALLGSATAMELQGAALTIAFTLEVLALVVVAIKVFPQTSVSSRLSLLFVIPILLGVSSLSSNSWRDGVLHSDFFVLVVLMGALMVAGWQLYLSADESSRHTAGTLYTVAALYFLSLIWLVVHAGHRFSSVGYEQGTVIALIIYTVLGIAAYIIGTRVSSKRLSLFGSLLLGGVVARLLLVEVWSMELVPRIITFFSIGTLLILTAFIRRQRKGSGDSNLVS